MKVYASQKGLIFNIIYFLAANEIKLPNGHSFEELIVSSIGKLGEKISLNCAKIFYTSPEFNIFGHSHPNGLIKILLKLK